MTWREEHDLKMKWNSSYRLRVREVKALEEKAAAERRLARVEEQRLAMESPEFAAELEARKPKQRPTFVRMKIRMNGEEFEIDSFDPTGMHLHALPPGAELVP